MQQAEEYLTWMKNCQPQFPDSSKNVIIYNMYACD
jgi:hypothetical protein